MLSLQLCSRPSSDLSLIREAKCYTPVHHTQVSHQPLHNQKGNWPFSQTTNTTVFLKEKASITAETNEGLLVLWGELMGKTTHPLSGFSEQGRLMHAHPSSPAGPGNRNPQSRYSTRSKDVTAQAAEASPWFPAKGDCQGWLWTSQVKVQDPVQALGGEGWRHKARGTCTKDVRVHALRTWI